MSMTPTEYNNKYRGKFVVDVTMRITIATRHSGMEGFSEVSSYLASQFRPVKVCEAYAWNTANLEDATLTKINPSEMAVPPMIEVPEEVVEDDA